MLLFITASWFSKCFKQNLLSFGLQCGFVSGLKKSEATFSKTFIYTHVMCDFPCSVLFSFQVRLQRWVWEVQTLSHNHLVTRGCGLQVYSSLQVSLHFFLLSTKCFEYKCAGLAADSFELIARDQEMGAGCIWALNSCGFPSRGSCVPVSQYRQDLYFSCLFFLD